MGPQLDSCGRDLPARDDMDADMLQWGRNLTVAEGSLHQPGLSAADQASMGPQLDSCGRYAYAGGKS